MESINNKQINNNESNMATQYFRNIYGDRLNTPKPYHNIELKGMDYPDIYVSMHSGRGVFSGDDVCGSHGEYYEDIDYAVECGEVIISHGRLDIGVQIIINPDASVRDVVFDRTVELSSWQYMNND
jgi:hypothetical protein